MTHKEIKKIDAHIAKAPAGKKLPDMWIKVKPIIVMARGLLFFKPEWQKVIDQFVAGMDAAMAAG